ncbi:MAG: antibiotic biosynthesis monooxygenase [Ruminococcaceae bacterium]|nr:antibiotic biosynthesis monooxygenase [Oscillospiraceae bacterium]
MLTMNLYYQMKPGKKQEFAEKIYALGIPQATQKEEGCIAYNFYVSPDKDEILLIEKWKNADCLPSHTKQEHFKKLISLKDEYVISTSCEKFE